MRTPSKIIVAVALAGMAIAGGAAFTAGGVSDTAGTSQFIGGTVTQSVDGAVLKSVVYGFSDGPQTTVSSISVTFTFDDAVLHVVKVTPTATGGVPDTALARVGATDEYKVSGLTLTDLTDLSIKVDNISYATA